MQSMAEGLSQPDKTGFKLFDFFANCEYFETEFNYDDVLELPPAPSAGGDDNGDGTGSDAPTIYGYEHLGGDILESIKEERIGYQGMKIDRMLFDRFADTVREDSLVKEAVEAGQWDRVIDYVNREVFNKPEEFYTLQRLRKAVSADRRVTTREFVEHALGIIPGFKSRDELLEEEFDKFTIDQTPPSPAALPAVRTYFKAYVTSDYVRSMIEKRPIRRPGDLRWLLPSRLPRRATRVS